MVMVKFRGMAHPIAMLAFFAAALCLMPGAARAAQDLLEAPACGARIFVAMGANQNYPGRDNMRVPRGDIYLNGVNVGAVSKNPEIAILDVPAGVTELSWVPSSYDDATREKTRRNTLNLTLAEKATAFVVLDWYDDTPNAATIGYRTEVAERNRQAFAGKRVVFHRPAATPCAPSETVAVAAPPRAKPVSKQAPKAPSPPPLPTEPQPEPSEAFMASLELYYIVNMPAGAPAYPSPNTSEAPLTTFPDKTELKVLDVSADKRWLTVAIPGSKRTGFVSAAMVTAGARAAK